MSLRDKIHISSFPGVDIDQLGSNHEVQDHVAVDDVKKIGHEFLTCLPKFRL